MVCAGNAASLERDGGPTGVGFDGHSRGDESKAKVRKYYGTPMEERDANSVTVTVTILDRKILMRY